MFRTAIRISLIILACTFCLSSCGGTIYDYVYDGDLYRVNAMIDSDPSLVHTTLSDETTPLLAAVYAGQLEIVKYLVSKGANVDAKDNAYHYTPLHAAVYTCNMDIAKYLIANGASINAKTISKETPLHLAVNCGDLKFVKYLISKGAVRSAEDQYGQTPLRLAELMGCQEIAVALKSERGGIKKTEENTISAKRPSFQKSMLSEPRELDATSFSGFSDIDFGNYFALVIGNNNYEQLPRLTTAKNDAIAISDVLERGYGFRVKLLLDATRFDIISALNEYRRKLSKGDNLLIYYAGHGYLDRAGDEGYWLPVNADANVEVNWISNSSLTTFLKAIEAKHVLVVADSCYSGKMARGLHIQPRTPDYYSRISKKRARSVLASGGLEPVLDKGPQEGHSVFASALLQAFEDNRGTMDGTALFGKIRRQVMLNADQTPEYSDIRRAGHEGGDFIFVRSR
ncbi:putative peptidase C14, caspase [Desulfosarcina variabilis str. Montpellier]